MAADKVEGKTTASSSWTLEPPDCFDFPFTPYPIQHDFMSRLFLAIEHGKIGIFESPTGTGKSLSLLTGALTWLASDDRRSEEMVLSAKSAQPADGADDDEPDWVKEHERTSLMESLRAKKAAREERLEKYRRLEKERNKASAGRERKRQRRADDESAHADEADGDESQYLPDVAVQESEGNLSENVRALLQHYSNRGRVAQDEAQEPVVRKIFVTSRTHSQLTQLIKELRKTKFATTTSVVPLASRKNLCINASVKRLGDVSLINERCLELQQSSTLQERRCAYLPKNDPVPMQDLRDRILAVPQDIEDLVALGREQNCCPFYGSRMAIPSAQLVTLPYNLLLSNETRATIDIDLRDQIVIIDEAHNLIDTICSLHTQVVTSTQLKMAQEQVSIYTVKFHTRLKGINLMHVQQLKLFLERLSAYGSVLRRSEVSSTQIIMTVNEFIQRSRIDQLNYAKLHAYLDESHLARKIQRYHTNAKGDEADGKASAGSPILHQIEGLLRALIYPDRDGRILASWTKDEWTLKYLLLNPSEQFKSIAAEARAVILAGGTMQPVKEVTTQLFPDFAEKKIELFSCSHVIPKENLLTLVLGMGPNKVEFSLTFEKRRMLSVIDEIGLTIANLCNVIPAGVVVFFPSYGYLEDVFRRWTETKLIDRLAARKKLFRESKESTSVESILSGYTAHLSKPGSGALLVAVVGGRLSEGINFSDNLGRGVIVVGMPFPNSQSAELQEKMRFVGELSHAKDRKQAEQEYYLNLCMKATNQTIGRAIRHAQDYATIILLDSRYSQKAIREKLPGWIDQSVSVCPTFGLALRTIAPFFRNKRVVA